MVSRVGRFSAKKINVKIVFISIMTRLPWGGSEFLWTEAAKAAKQNGHDVMASVFSWSKHQPNIQALVNMGIKLHTRRHIRLPGIFQKVLNRIAGELYQRRWIPAPYRGVKKFAPDVICVSQGGSIDVAFDGVQQLLTDTDKPFFIISQSNFEHHLYSMQIIPGLQKIFQKAEKLLFVAYRNKEVLERQVCMMLPNSAVIANPVNLKEKNLLPFPPFHGGKVNFACVGRLECEAKGQDILIQTLSSPAWKNREWELNLYGKGHHEPYLQLLCRQFGIADRVHFHGHVQDIAEIWYQNHLLIMPSLREGTPLALIESMACGRPAVVTDVGGNADYCIEGKTGFLAEAPNVKYLGAALERAWQARDSWQQMGRQAYAFYLEHTDTSPGESLLKLILQP